jgi:hypothetical protein
MRAAEVVPATTAFASMVSPQDHWISVLFRVAGTA